LLKEEIMEEVIREVRCQLAQQSSRADTEAPKLEREARELRAQNQRLVQAIALGHESPTIVKEIAVREERLAEIDRLRAVLRSGPGTVDLQLRRLEREARTRLENLRGLVARNPDEARPALESLFDGPLTFTPEGRRYRIEGAVSFGEALCTTAGDPNGFCTV
jgi:hypothetical protein